MRYLQRDGTTRDGERGALYGPESDNADGKAFLAKGASDRHQFRFIVAPEDGAEYEDLKPLTRRLMTQMEQDLGTRLDWVAVDHFNTGHPHSHILVRGTDERGKEMIIARSISRTVFASAPPNWSTSTLAPAPTSRLRGPTGGEISQKLH